jgi:hypothetical protein
MRVVLADGQERAGVETGLFRLRQMVNHLLPTGNAPVSGT